MWIIYTFLSAFKLVLIAFNIAKLLSYYHLKQHASTYNKSQSLIIDWIENYQNSFVLRYTDFHDMKEKIPLEFSKRKPCSSSDLFKWSLAFPKMVSLE